MVDADKESNVFVGESHTGKGVVEPRVGAAKANGCATDMDASSSGFGGGFLTYRRRRNAKVGEDGIVWVNSETQPNEKSINNSFDQDSEKRHHAAMIASSDCSLKHQRDIVLEEICKSLGTDGGLKKCIQDALAFHPGSGSRTAVKDSVQYCEVGSKIDPVCEGLQNAIKNSLGMASSRSVDESNQDIVTELCRCCFSEIIMSEKFAQLCSLFLEYGIRADKLFDLSHINSKMKEKKYGSSPLLFHSDIQEIWKKLKKLGDDIISLSKALSDKTITSLREQVGSCAHSICKDGDHEFLTEDSDMQKAELTEVCALHKVDTCMHYGEKTDGRNGLVCDSCEHMYHISCIKPLVKEIPVRSWNCASGIGSLHDNCVAYERLNSSRSPFYCSREDEVVYEEAPGEFEESSNELAAKEGNKRFPHCKACRTEVRNDEDYRICGHSFCPNKFYHVKCMTSKQLISYGPCWYCPSCLCRACLVDRDDDKIVLCDGCDHAYHIYCMQPLLTAIPRGKWFCAKCNAGIQCVHKARYSYENMQNKSKKRSLDGKLKTEEALNKSGGVDMLLNAAKTLNCEENLIAMGLKG